MKEMEEKPGGAPPEIAKPKPVKAKLSFAFDELDLMDIIKIDGSNYLTFIIRDEWIVTMRQWDYFEFLNFTYNTIADSEDSVIIISSPDYEVLEQNNNIKGTFFDVTNNKKEDFNKYISHVEAYNLLENIEIITINHSNE